MKDLQQQSQDDPDPWPTGSSGERASYNNQTYVYQYTDGGYWWYVSEVEEAIPYYVRYDYNNTELWYNGMGDLLDPPPTAL